MLILQHQLDCAKQIPSPNYDERPDASDISLVVIHCISLPPAEFGHDYIHQLFCNQLQADAHPYFATICHLKVSAHVLIRRDGELVQYVPFDKRAWHAGVSRYQGREKCNDFSIGIELEGIESIAYTDAQYEQLAKVLNCLLKTYPNLSKQTLTGHSDIASERKTDPGPLFEWDRLLALMA
jgi:N-acetyl-anhydromuramoyl-L-alanine amidase